MNIILDNKIRIAQIGLAIIYISGLIPFLPFVVDDAFISFVYSKNLILGNGLTYNGILVEGYSNPLWTILISPLLALGVDAILAARVISIISGLICILLIFQLSLSFTDHNKLIYPFLATASITVLAPFLAWTLGGLETLFLSALITVLVYIEWLNYPSKRLWSPILLLLIALTRPEGILVFVVWLIYTITFSNKQIKEVFLNSLLFCIPFLTFLYIRWLSYGNLLPNTAYIKVDPGISVAHDALIWLGSFLTLRPIFGILLLLGIYATLRQKPINKKILLPFGISLGYIAFVIFSGRDWMPHHRFITPIIPLLALPIVGIFNHFKKPILTNILVILTVISIGFEMFMILNVFKPLSLEFGKFTKGLIQAGEWIEVNTEDSDTIAVVDAGALAYYSERKTIDILGLNDGHISHSKNKMDSDYVLKLKPQVIQLHAAFSEEGELKPPTDTDHNLSILEHPEFLRCYTPNISRPNDPYYPFLFLRNCD